MLLLKNVLFTLVVPGTVGVLVPLALAPNRLAHSVWQMAGACELLAVGAAIYAWCVWDFASFGRGTPAPIDPPTRLVVRGLYRCVRNPMYLGVLCVIAGLAALHGSWTVAAYGGLVATSFHLFVVLYEEPHLHSIFGEEYARYCRQVRRWLPGPPRSVDGAT